MIKIEAAKKIITEYMNTKFNTCRSENVKYEKTSITNENSTTQTRYLDRHILESLSNRPARIGYYPNHKPNQTNARIRARVEKQTRRD
jgi:hypothetical protein